MLTIRDKDVLTERPTRPDTILTAHDLWAYQEHIQPEDLLDKIKNGGELDVTTWDRWIKRNLWAAMDQNSTVPLSWE
jgi:hypothetical protein